MSPLWIVPAVLVLAGAFPVALAFRRAHDETLEALRSFEAFRAALRPAVLSVRDDALAASRRVRGPGSPPASPSRRSGRSGRRGGL